MAPLTEGAYYEYSQVNHKTYDYLVSICCSHDAETSQFNYQLETLHY